MSSKRLLIIAGLLTLLGLGVAAYWINHIGGDHFIDGILTINPVYIILLLLITCFFIFIRFIRWQFLLRQISVRIPIRSSFLLYLSSLVGIATPGYIGEAVLRSAFLRKQFAVPIRVTVWVFVQERLLDVVVLASIFLLIDGTSGFQWVASLILLGMLLLWIILYFVAPRLGIATNNIMKPVIIFQSILLSFILWLPVTAMISISALSVNQEVGVLFSMQSFSIATLLGGLSFMPAGVGTTGSVAILQLQEYGMALPLAVIVITLVRISTTGVTLLVSVIFLIRQWSASWAVNNADNEQHFDVIASEYKVQFQEHVWDYLLDKKVNLMVSHLRDLPDNAIGLDLGCGLGQQALRMQSLGYNMIGLDMSIGLLNEAQNSGLMVINGSAVQLPLPDNSVDFIYMVGILHHLPDKEFQRKACNEVMRVLKPNGLFLVHETNPKNILFRFYMGYIFPLLKTIDEGIEIWLDPKQLSETENLKLEDTIYFTFLPDFIPSFLMKPLRRLERKLENSSARAFSVHYMAVLRKLK